MSASFGGGEGAREVREIELQSPAAKEERSHSRTEYAGLNGAQAVALGEKVFGFQRPVWRSPIGEAGAHVSRYDGEQAVAETLPNGQHVMVESEEPLRSAVGSGELAPVSLSLEQREGSYEPANPVAPVSISKSAASGVSLPYGISVTPVQAAEPEASQVVGNRVIFPGTATDADFMVEPVAAGEGIDTAWQLLSENSPEENSLAFKLPAGASLQMSKEVPGGAEIVSDGQQMVLIPPAAAIEADGTSLPVSYSISGDVLSTHVNLSGSVDFPVEVDPALWYGDYGQYGGGSWAGWSYYSNCGCINSEERTGLLWIWTEPGPANGDFGEWYIWAPGAGEPGGASITRVWIDEMTHSPTYQSSVDAEIGEVGDYEDKAPEPIWTDNGAIEAEHPDPMTRDDTYTEDLEFCADWAGGYWGKSNGQPLCNENFGGRFFDFLEVMGPEGRTVDNYTGINGAIIVYLDETPPNEVKLEGLPTGWVRYGPSYTYIHAHDQGTGIAAVSIESPPGEKVIYKQENACKAYDGFDGCPQTFNSEYFNFSSSEVNGVYTLGVRADDAAGNFREEKLGGPEGPDPRLYVDHSPPEIMPFKGSLAEAAGKIGAGDYTLNFEATAGSTSKPGDGLKELSLSVDGTKVDEVKTSCPEPTEVPASNCFGLSGSWTMEGEHYGAGTHTVTVTATDWLGNTASESMKVTAAEAPSTVLGPGEVNLKTGDYKLSATDVDVASPGAELAVSRSYESRDLTAGAEGPLGPQWALSLPDSAAASVFQSLHAEPGGSVQATLAEGLHVSFTAKSGGGFESPTGYQTETLSEPAKGEYRLTNAAGDATIFKHDSGEAEGSYVPSGAVQASGAGGLNKVSYLFTRASGITEPTAVIAPSPPGVECEREWIEAKKTLKGCRILGFNYAESTTASGEGPEEWGDYKGRLTRVYLHAWDPSKGEVVTKTLAQYAYDTKGRLRAEWNPEVSPALKTVYGYDAEGQVTSLTEPGQETWAFTYGSDTAEANPGRLIKVLQAPASTALWKGEALNSTEAPTITGSPVIGTRMGVSKGKWSGSPVAYGFRWEDCNAAGAQCTAIPGADNANYTPTGSDYGHTLVAQVTATNGGGSVLASSAPSAVVANATESFGEHKLSSPFEAAHDIAAGSEGDMWWTDSDNHQVGKITPSGETTAYAFPSGVCLGGITPGPDHNMWTVEECTSRIAKITSSGTITEYDLPAESYPRNIVAGSNGELWFTEWGTHRIGEITTSGAITEYRLPQKNSEPFGITTGPEGDIWFTDYATSKIGKITTSGAISEYSLPSYSYPYGIADGPEGDIWYTEEQAGKVGKMTSGGTIAGEYSLPSGSYPTAIAATPEGNLRFTETGANRLGEVTPSGAVSEYDLPSGSEPVALAVGPDDNHVWFTDRGTDEIGDFATRQVSEYALPSGSHPFGITSGPAEALWFTDSSSGKVGKITTSGAVSEFNAEKDEPEGITTGPDGNLWFVEHSIRHVNHMTPAGSLTVYTLTRTSTYNWGITAGPDGNLWFTESETGYIGKINTKDEVLGEYALPSGSRPYGIASGPDGNLWFTDEGTSKIGKITTSGAITEYALPSGSKPMDIATGPEGDLWFTDQGTSKIGKITTSGVITEYALPSGSEPYGITNGPESESAVWFTDYGTAKLGRITASGAITEYALPSGSEPTAIADGPDGRLWFDEYGTSRIGAYAPATQPSEAEAQSPQPGWTVDYNVPISGQGAPYEMGSSEVQKWAQTDDPVNATAIFPPEEPQSWPASKYSKQTVYYLDSQERLVNVANPAGGIATTEYEAHDNIMRTLSADDRATAIKEGSKSAEAAEHLSTLNNYNSEGTELESALGPEHEVKVPGVAGEVLARKHTVYTYDQGAPTEGGPYYMVTETKEGAQRTNSDREETDIRTTSDSYSGQEGLGWKLREPTSTTTAPNGLSLTHTTLYNPTTGAEIETRMPSHSDTQIDEYAAKGEGEPWAIAKGPDGNLWFTMQSGGQIEKITPSGAVSEYKGVEGAAQPRGIASGPDGNLWFTEYGLRRIGKMSTAGSLLNSYEVEAAAEDYGITEGPDGNLWYVSYESGKIAKITTSGSYTAYSLPSGSKPYDITKGPDGNLWATEEGTSKIAKITTSGAVTEYALPSGSEPRNIAAGPDGKLWFTEYGTNKIGKITTSGTITEYALPSETGPEGITAGPEEKLWFTEYTANKVASITTSGSVSSYSLPSGSEPRDITAGPENTVWFTEYGTKKIGELATGSAATGNEGAHDSQIIYYTAGTEASVPSCQDHPEWAGLACQTQPAHQPEVAGTPELPVTTFTYNVYDEPLVTTSTAGTSTQTQTDEYDVAGRLIGKQLISSVGDSLPKVSYSYSETTGALIKQSTGSGGEEQKITSSYDTWGELTSYTDANESTSTYKYDEYGRLSEAEEGPGSQTYSYNPTTGELTGLKDSAAGTFTASYGPEGNLETETYPNGMTACYKINAVGEATSLEYFKSTQCGSGTVWFHDSLTPSIGGESASQESSLSSESYAYNEAGTLTEVQETPTGKGCVVRLYGYDEDDDRTSLTTREPGTEGKCATEGGSTETHAYDTANQLVDPGVEYNPFGDITKLPASDAGGSALESSFYTDGQLATQSQNGLDKAYSLDPARRTNSITISGTQSGQLIEHYSSEGDAPSWASELDGKWTRYIPGIGTDMAAIQTQGETPVLQLTDLQGNIVATAEDNESATKLLSTSNSTEYGVPTSSKPARYSWLGSVQLPTELPSGVVAMGARSYVPELGRFLQPDPQPGGSANAYAYTHGNPINEADPSGEWSIGPAEGVAGMSEGEGIQLANGVGLAAGAITPAPVNEQIEAEAQADPPWDQITAASEEAEEYGEGGGRPSGALSAGRGSTRAKVRYGLISYSGDGCASTCPDAPHNKEYAERDKGSGCRSGASSKGKCVVNYGKDSKACAEVFGAIGGFLGGGVGGAVAGPGGAIAGGAAGGEAGAKAGEAICSG